MVLINKAQIGAKTNGPYINDGMLLKYSYTCINYCFVKSLFINKLSLEISMLLVDTGDTKESNSKER